MFRKKSGLLVAGIIAVTVLLTGCGEAKQEKVESDITMQEDFSLIEETSEAGQMTEASSEAAVNENTSKNQTVRDKYAEILKKFMTSYTLPDGTQLDYDGMSDFSQNQFAIYDIDGDGREELIMVYSTCCMASMCEIIYEYDAAADKMNEEFYAFPSVTFFENGSVKEEWSHNQGMAGSFWPFTIHQYDAATDTYMVKGSVDAWDKSVFPESIGAGEPFPDDKDIDGDGMLYFISEPDEYNDDAPVDLAEYKQWEASLLGTEKELTIPYMAMTEENVCKQ